MYVYEDFDDAKTETTQVLFKSKSRPRKQRSRRKLNVSLTLLKKSLSDCKGLASQHSF